MRIRPNRTTPKQIEEKKGPGRLIPIDDRTFDSLEWADVDCAGLPLIMAGKKILGSEPIKPDGFILYLEDSAGKISVLEVTCSIIAGTISLFCAEVPKRKEASV